MNKFGITVLAIVAMVIFADPCLAVIPTGELVNLEADLFGNLAPPQDEDWQNIGLSGGRYPKLANGGTLGHDGDGTAYLNVTGGGYGGIEVSVLHLEDWTASMWLRRTGTGSSNEHHIAAINSTVGDQMSYWILVGTGKDTIEWRNKGQFGGDTGGMNTGVVLPLDTWTHLVFTYDDTSKDMNMYVNGNLTPAFSSNLPALDWGWRNMDYSTVGPINPNEAGGRSFDGDFSTHRIWDRVLSSSEITQLYNHGRSGYIPEPATMALLGIGGLTVLRRRRSA